MKILAIDTANPICSVALLDDEKVLEEMENKEEREHSVALMPMINDILKSQKLTINDIDLLACSRGPGSFTGIRIGMATVKAFADAKNIPVVGVNSLEALAYAVIMKNGTEDCKIASYIDAKNNNVYCGVYRMKNGILSVYKNPDVMSITETIEYLNFKNPLFLAGDSIIETIEPLLVAKESKDQAEGKDTAGHEYVTDIPVSAEAIGFAALKKYEKGLYGDSDSISPMYLRKTQAERQKEGESETLALLEMSVTDVETIEENYDDFPNIWNYETLKEDFENSKYIVARQNNKIVGFIGVKQILDELEIMNIVTEKNSRNQGIASNLLSYVIRKFDVNKINLEVNEHNKVAISLYKKFGFIEVGRRKKYYNNQDDAILMTM